MHSTDMAVDVTILEDLDLDRELDEDVGTLDTYAPNSDFGSVILEQKNLLKINVGGFIGLIERIPIQIKLLATQPSTIGMIVLAALLLAIQVNSLNNAYNTQAFDASATEIFGIISAFQTERDRTSVALNSAISDPNNTNIYIKGLIPFYISSNTSDQSFRSTFSGYFNAPTSNLTTYITGDRIITQIINYNTQLALLESTRFNVQNGLASGPQVFSYYTSVIAPLQDILILFTNGANTPTTNSYVSMIKLLESQQRVKGQGEAMLITRTINYITARAMAVNVALRDSSLDIAMSSSADDISQLYQNLTNAATLSYLGSAELALALSKDNMKTSPISNAYSLSDWVNNTNQVITGTRATIDYISSKVDKETAAIINLAVTLIIIICVLVLVFAAVCILTTILMSVSIIGPWVRMNNALETAISKFVPSALLGLIGSKDISDIKLGQSNEQELTLMTVKINNFDQVTTNLVTSKTFDVLKSYLAVVGGVVGKSGGFIHRYNPDGFVAGFKNPPAALDASIKIQHIIDTYNKNRDDNQGVPILLSACVQYSHCVVGTIGDEKRMEGAIVIQDNKISTKLDVLSALFKSDVITTLKTFEKCGRLTKRIKHRNLGTMSDGTEVIEVLNTDPAKLEYKNDFEKAVLAFRDGRYGDAHAQFKSIVNEFNLDTVAKKYFDRINRIIDNFRCKITELPTSNYLTDPVLRDAFKVHCVKEHSPENILFWEEVEKFRELTDAQVLYDEAFRLNNEYVISVLNIDDIKKQQIAAALTQHEVCNTTFDVIQVEIKKVMEDSLARFLMTPACFNALSKFYKDIPLGLDDL